MLNHIQHRAVVVNLLGELEAGDSNNGNLSCSLLDTMSECYAVLFSVVILGQIETTTVSVQYSLVLFGAVKPAPVGR